MAGGVVLKWESDATPVLKANKDIQNETAKTDATYRLLTKTTAEMGRVAEKAYKDTLTVSQEYIRRLQGIQEAKKNGIITERQAAAAVKQTTDAWKKIPPELRNTEMGLASVELAQRKALGKGFLSNLGDIKLALGAIGAAAAAAGKSIAEMNKIRESGKAGVQGYMGSYAQLGQLSTDSKVVQDLRKRSKDLFASGVGSTIDEPASLIFQLQSAGMLADQDLFARGARTGLLANPAETAKQLSGVARNFRGKDPTGTTMQLLSKAAAASSISRESIDDIMTLVGIASSTAGEAGVTDEETYAAVGALTTGLKKEPTGTYLAGLYQVLANKNVKGETFASKLRNVEQTVGKMSAQDRKDWFGRDEAARAYNFLIGNKDLYAEALGRVYRGQSDRSFEFLLRNQEAAPDIRRNVNWQSAQNKLQLDRERAGVDQMWQEGRDAEREMILRRLGVPEAAIGATNAGLGVFSGAIGSTVDRSGVSPGSDNSMMVWGAMLSSMKKTEQNTQRQSRPRVPAPEN